MTTSGDSDVPRSPSGFVTGAVLDVLRQIEETGEAVANGLPVRLYHPVAGAADNVIAHFSYAPEEPWSIFGDVARGPHGLVISRMEILTEEASSGVTAGLLRKIQIGEVLSAIRAKAALESARREGTRVLLREEPVPGLFAEGDKEKPRRRGGRAPMTPDLLREVSLAYLRETAPGAPVGGMKRMAEQFGRPEETIRTWVTRARKDGWLGPSAKGRAGAEPGHKLIVWLGEQMNSDGALHKETCSIAIAFGADDPEATAVAATRAYRDQAELEFPSRVAVGPLLLNVVAQVLYGRSIGAELAARAGASEEDRERALDEIGREVRRKIAEHEQGPV